MTKQKQQEGRKRAHTHALMFKEKLAHFDHQFCIFPIVWLVSSVCQDCCGNPVIFFSCKANKQVKRWPLFIVDLCLSELPWWQCVCCTPAHSLAVLLTALAAGEIKQVQVNLRKICLFSSWSWLNLCCTCLLLVFIILTWWRKLFFFLFSVTFVNLKSYLFCFSKAKPILCCWILCEVFFLLVCLFVSHNLSAFIVYIPLGRWYPSSLS